MSENVVHLVLARLPDAPAGSRGLSLFLVPKFLPDAAGRPGERNDMRCIGLERKLGLHASPTCTMAYGEGAGAVGWLVGAPGRGLVSLFAMMNDARLGVAQEGLGVAERAYQQARAYAFERRQGRTADDAGPVPIVRHAEVRRMLLAMKARVAAMRLLCYYAAWCADLAVRHPDAAARAAAEARLRLLTPVAKAWCTDGAADVASTAIQVHGGAGYIEETGAAQHLRDARVTQIYEGTNGIQALDLVRRKLAGDGGGAALALIAEIARFAEAGGAARAALADAAATLADVTRRLVERCRSAPASAEAGAYPCLVLYGSVISGWLLARAAALDGGATMAATARFFAASHLAQAGALAHAALDGADSAAAAEEKFF